MFPTSKRRWVAAVVAPMLAAVLVAVTTQTANAGKPDISGPSCTLEGSSTVCVTTLPAHGPQGDVYETFGGCRGVGSLLWSGPNAYDRGHQISSTWPGQGIYQIEVRSRSGRSIHQATDTTC